MGHNNQIKRIAKICEPMKSNKQKSELMHLILDRLEGELKALAKDQVMDEFFDFGSLQQQVGVWADANFRDHDKEHAHRPAMGMAEELGEIATHLLQMQSSVGIVLHGKLKSEQHLRVCDSVHIAEMKDGIADTIIFAADLCHLMGWDLQTVIETVWGRVKQRDWKTNPHGPSPTNTTPNV